MLDLFFETCRPYMIVISKINSNFLQLSSKCEKISYLPSQLTSAVCVHNRKTKSVLESMLKTSVIEFPCCGRSREYKTPNTSHKLIEALV